MSPPLSDSRVVAFLGAAGSGKTEVALNLALAWAQSYGRVAIVDFDYVTPYFRSQDVRERVAARGLEVIASPPEFHDFDVPVVPPEIPHVILDERRRMIFDVGGDEMGARMLGQLRRHLEAASAAAYVVVNSRRPQTRHAEAVAEAVRTMEEACGLRVRGLVANSNVGPETDEAICLEGVRVTTEAGRLLSLPVVMVACLARLAEGMDRPGGPAVLPLVPQLAPPWAA